MRENSDDLDLSTCLRHARRWFMGLLCLLAINGSLVALAFGGFGAARPPLPRSAVAPLAVSVAPAPVRPLATAPVKQPAESPADALVPRVIAPPPETTSTEPTPGAPPPATDPPPAPGLPPSPVVDPPPAVNPPVNVSPDNVAPANAVPPPATESLIVANAPDIGGAVNFTVDDVVYTLAPGEYVELKGRTARRIEFHRGDDFGYATQELERGVFAFEVAAAGWSLQPLEPAAARKLLEACRAK